MKLRVFLFAIFTFCSFTLSFAQEPINGTLMHDGLEREYVLYVPDTYDGTDEVPLVLCFHGFGSSAAINYFYTNFRAIADTANFILVHPQGTEIEGFNHWNVGGFTEGSTVDDVGFTEALIEDLSANYEIDQDRVYSTGMSNGGYMSYLLACQLSDKIAAIASVTGSMTSSTFTECDCQHPMPVMQIHGTDDPTVPYEGESDWTISIPEIAEYWAEFNSCNLSPQITEIPDINTSDGSTVEKIVYSDGDNCTSVELFKVIGGGHDWPGAFGNMDIDSSLEIWNFFSQYDINGLINCSTSVEENNMDSHLFSVYPNPFDNVLTIQSKINGNTEYKILNLLGETVKSGVLTSTKTEVDLSAFSSNFYFVQVGEATYKVLKN